MDIQHTLKHLRSRLTGLVTTIDAMAVLPEAELTDLLSALGVQETVTAQDATRTIIKTILAAAKTPPQKPSETPPSISGKSRQGGTYTKKSGYRAYPTTRYLMTCLQAHPPGTLTWKALVAYFQSHHPGVKPTSLKAAIRRALYDQAIFTVGDFYSLAGQPTKVKTKGKLHPTGQTVVQILRKEGPLRLDSLVLPVQAALPGVNRKAIRSALVKLVAKGTVKTTLGETGKVYEVAGATTNRKQKTS